MEIAVDDDSGASEITIQFASFGAAQYAFRQLSRSEFKRPFFRFVPIIVLAVAQVVAAIVMVYFDVPRLFAYGFFLGVFCGLAVLPDLQNWFVRRLSPDAFMRANEGPYTIRLNETGVTTSATFYSSHRSWALYALPQLVTKGIILRSGAFNGLAVPISALPSDLTLAQLRDKIRDWSYAVHPRK